MSERQRIGGGTIHDRVAEATRAPRRGPGSLPRKSWPRSYRIVFGLVVVAVAIFYTWCVRVGNGRFDWRSEGNGFYNLLARGFAAGHLYVPVDPSPQLLALPDPWDPAKNGEYGIQDMALYNRRYYVYHGATPALVLFTPWFLLTGRDLPESFAGLLFSLIGYLCAGALFLRVLEYKNARPPLPVFSLLLLALGICQCVPFLLQRVVVYEVAIAAGYATVSAGFLLLANALLGSPRPAIALAFSGLFLGLAIGCRPHLAFSALLAFLMVLWLRRTQPAIRLQDVAAFTVPAALCAVSFALYNYARFGDLFEFGLRYQLASPAYFRPLLSFANLRAGLYYLFVCPPGLDPVFPFVRLMMRVPFELPRRYFLEPIAGILPLAPLSAAAVALPVILKRQRDPVLASLTAAICLSALASAAAIAALGLISQRYEVDFLPFLLLAGCWAWALLESEPHAVPRYGRLLVRGLLGAALLYCLFAGLAIGIQGPYEDFVQKHPSTYVKIAHWFSPVRRYRPVLNPHLRAEATYNFPANMPSTDVPLIAAGRFGTRYVLTAVPQGGNRLRLNATGTLVTGAPATANVDVVPGVPNRVTLEYDPTGAMMSVAWNGVPVLRQPLRVFITAPAQFTVGEDHSGIDTWQHRFPGEATVLSKWIDGVEYR